MRVTLCVDALEPQPGGIGRYTWQLCRGLSDHPDISELTCFARGRIIADPEVLVRGEGLQPLPRWRRWLDGRRTGRVLSGTLVHSPNYFLPGGVEGGIITVHDLSVFRYPETHPAERVRAFEREFHSSLRRAAHILTDTETVRRELIEDFSVPPQQVSTVWLGVNRNFRPLPPGDLAPSLAALGLTPGGYGLCVSTLEPRKKIAELLAAWRMLPRGIRDRFPLVLAGAKGWRNDELREQVADALKEGWLKHLGFVDEAMLPTLYAGAALFVYPSAYEGFGLPPIEAMASGVPTIVSNRSCLPEVCGDAVEYVDPDQPINFVETLERCLNDEKLRSSLIKRGLSRAGLFDWNRCIEGTVLAYKEVQHRI